MNKNDLVEALARRLGDRTAAALAVEAVVDVVLREVARGGTVGITGFGTFEAVERAPRTGRNPHTGDAVPIPAARSPRFRPGTYFKDVVADPGQLPEAGLAGARVGSMEWGTSDAGAGRGSGAPASVRRRTDPKEDRPGSTDGASAPATTKRQRRRPSGTPETVRAARPEPDQAPAGEAAYEPAGGARRSVGGEQITRDMISAKKAQLARAKDGQAADEKAATASTKGAKKGARKDRKAGREKEQRGKKDKKKGRDKKGKKS